MVLIFGYLTIFGMQEYIHIWRRHPVNVTGQAVECR